MNFDFQKWFTCWEDFRNFEEIFFCFPHSTPICKFDHDHLLKEWYFFKSFFQNVDQFSPYLTSKYISKSNCVLHVGKFYKKNHFFGWRFFKFHRHVVLFSCKKRAKKRLPVVIFIKKISRKNEKNRKNFPNFPNMWHKKAIFSRNIYIWVILRKMIQCFEKCHFRCFADKFTKFTIANRKLMILTTVNTYQFSSVLPLIILLIIY